MFYSANFSAEARWSASLLNLSWLHNEDKFSLTQFEAKTKVDPDRAVQLNNKKGTLKGSLS